MTGNYYSTELHIPLVAIHHHGKQYEYTFYKVGLTQTGDQALKGEDFATLSFEGEILVDDTQLTGSQFFTIKQIGE